MPDDEPAQRTKRGTEIPVPKRDDFLRDLKRVARRRDPDDDESDARRAEDER